MRYFKRHWIELRGDEHDSWGKSDWWSETDNEGFVTRCIQRYQNGNVLLYTEFHKEDEFGMLPEGTIDLADFEEHTIGKKEFEETLNSVKPINVQSI